MIAIDDPRVLAEVDAASAAYEMALAAGAVETLVAAFWPSARAVRLGDDGELFGADERTRSDAS